MVTEYINKPIGSNYGWVNTGEDPPEYGLNELKKLFEDNKNETEFTFEINCPGGSVSEGAAMYDFMRTSGKTIYTNIVGGCHSMAIVILLGAPYENRTANPLATALFHDVRAQISGSTEEIKKVAEEMERDRNTILKIYQDRTNRSISSLEDFMLEEKERTADELLSWGFISRINNYNTNIKQTEMDNLAKAKDQATKNKSYLASLIFGRKNEAPVVSNFTDSGGNIMFTANVENRELAVGATASPDGVFYTGSHMVNIADGVITDIKEVNIFDIIEENSNLKSVTQELENKLKSTNEIMSNLVAEQEQLRADQVDLRNSVGSNYTAAGRASVATVRTAIKKGSDTKAENVFDYDKLASCVDSFQKPKNR